MLDRSRRRVGFARPAVSQKQRTRCPADTVVRVRHTDDAHAGLPGRMYAVRVLVKKSTAVSPCSRAAWPDDALSPPNGAWSIAPYDERAHRNLMNALRASGNPSGAAKVERDFTERLDTDLGVAPSPDFFVSLTSSS